MSAALVACDVFRAEIDRFLPDFPPARLRYLPMGLHDNPGAMREQIRAAIAEVERDPDVDTVLLAYGLCGNGTLDLAAGRCRLIIPRMHDCITMFLGSRRRYEEVLREHPHAYFYTPGWNREHRTPGPDHEAHARKQLEEKYDDPEDVEFLLETQLGFYKHNDTAVHINLGDCPAPPGTGAEYTRRCAECLGWKFVSLVGDPALLRRLVNGPWNDDEFLVVPPGGKVQPDYDGKIFK